MVDYPHCLIEEKKISVLKSKYSFNSTAQVSFDVAEKCLSSHRLERAFSIRIARSEINAALTYPEGTGFFQRWLGRLPLAGDIVDGGNLIGRSRLDRSTLKFTLEIFDASGSLVWKCRPLFPRKPGTSILIVDSNDQEHGRVFGDREGYVGISSIFTSQWPSGIMSEDVADRASSADTQFLLFLVAFTVADRLIAMDIDSGQ